VFGVRKLLKTGKLISLHQGKIPGWNWEVRLSMFVKRVSGVFRRLQWKLTLSYSAVTVGALLVVVLILGVLLFSKVLVPLDILNSVLSPGAWLRIASENTPPHWSYILSQEPVDTRLLSMVLRSGDLQVSYFDLLRIGDLQIRVRTTGRGGVLVVSPEKIVLGVSDSDFLPTVVVDQPLDTALLPGLEDALEAALRGEVDPERLFVTIEPNERFYFVVPYMDESGQRVLGAGIVYFEDLPTENDLPANVMLLIGRSLLVLLLAAGLVGTLFGALTARGMVKRLQRVSQAAEAWSQGDFSEFIHDPSGDELGLLAGRLNQMAGQLQDYIRRSRAMAVSEERNRLARDLHDSAKQEALAASFHLGAALTLFEGDPTVAENHLVEADKLVDSVRLELSDLIHQLRPASLEGVRFAEMVDDYMIEWAHQTGINAALQVQGETDISLEIRQAIYRIMQEALANVARHSGAGEVKLSLTYHPQAVEFVVDDDGAGFDPNQRHNGIGLDSMRERAGSLGGDLLIESRQGEGTSVTVKIPLL
jgi:NarL family two-component system sensor histidine kinase LiaS